MIKQPVTMEEALDILQDIHGTNTNVKIGKRVLLEIDTALRCLALRCKVT